MTGFKLFLCIAIHIPYSRHLSHYRLNPVEIFHSWLQILETQINNLSQTSVSKQGLKLWAKAGNEEGKFCKHRFICSIVLSYEWSYGARSSE